MGVKKFFAGHKSFENDFGTFSGFELQQLTQPRRIPKQVVRLEEVPDLRNEHFPGVPESFPAADADQRHRQRPGQRLPVDRHCASGRDRASPEIGRKFRAQPGGGDRSRTLRRGRKQRGQSESDEFLNRG